MIIKLLSILGLSLLLCSFAGAARPQTKTALFAGGCFWCMEHPFEKIPGVVEVTSGYTGGKEKDPDYESVSSGNTGHTEAVKITYDPGVVSYEDLLEVYFRQIDPTDNGGQFVDRGSQYRPEIFFEDEMQKNAALAKIKELENSGRFNRKIIVPVTPAGPFYDAEEYHQDFYKKSSARYEKYRMFSGRDQFIKKTWGDESLDASGAVKKKIYSRPGDDELRKRLTPLQFEVVRKNGTERAFSNQYWDNKQPGVYVDIVSGEPLFSSLDKYDSGTGWPSFTRPLVEDHVTTHEDRGLFMVRTEVRSRYGDSHLGHVFNDGPAPTGLRYCINSAAMRFVPVDELEREGLSEFLPLFNR